MMDDRYIVLGSLSLRQTLVTQHDTTNNDVLRSLSLRETRVQNSTTTNNNVLTAHAMAIAGFEHQGGGWPPPEDLSYVTIFM